MKRNEIGEAKNKGYTLTISFVYEIENDKIKTGDIIESGQYNDETNYFVYNYLLGRNHDVQAHLDNYRTQLSLEFKKVY